MTEWTNVRVERDLLEAFHALATRRMGREDLSRAGAVRLALRACIHTWEEDPAEPAPRPDLIGLGDADLRRYARLQRSCLRIAQDLMRAAVAYADGRERRQAARGRRTSTPPRRGGRWDGRDDFSRWGAATTSGLHQMSRQAHLGGVETVLPYNVYEERERVEDH
ncbi:hypothetical protein [Candidatus Palauibacter sp.]|uniref:hypothetical protein n=1 Tax=Candidatus Palauibacter sp. TaxID=3101350 RepID=UPI003C6EEE99